MEKPTWAQSEPDLCVQLEERPRFETLLANLSACFVNVPPDHVYAEIVDVQRSFCECLGFDLSALWQQPTGAPRHFRADSLLSISGGASGSRPHVRLGKEGSSAYKPTQVQRRSVMTFEKGKPGFILDDPQGTPWVIRCLLV
jgi:hypothetical protein